MSYDDLLHSLNSVGSKSYKDDFEELLKKSAKKAAKNRSKMIQPLSLDLKYVNDDNSDTDTDTENKDNNNNDDINCETKNLKHTSGISNNFVANFDTIEQYYFELPAIDNIEHSIEDWKENFNKLQNNPISPLLLPEIKGYRYFQFPPNYSPQNFNEMLDEFSKFSADTPCGDWLIGVELARKILLDKPSPQTSEYKRENTKFMMWQTGSPFHQLRGFKHVLYGSPYSSLYNFTYNWHGISKMAKKPNTSTLTPPVYFKADKLELMKGINAKDNSQFCHLAEVNDGDISNMLTQQQLIEFTKNMPEYDVVINDVSVENENISKLGGCLMTNVQKVSKLGYFVCRWPHPTNWSWIHIQLMLAMQSIFNKCKIFVAPWNLKCYLIFSDKRQSNCVNLINLLDAVCSYPYSDNNLQILPNNILESNINWRSKIEHARSHFESLANNWILPQQIFSAYSNFIVQIVQQHHLD
jgi:hypothetical protein